MTDAGLVPVMVKDGNGRTLCAAESAWIVKMTPVEFAKEAGEREWVLETDNILIFVGGI